MTQTKVPRLHALLLTLAAIALAPSTLRAGHAFDHALLLPAVEQLHADAQHFEQIACECGFRPHEVNYIRLLTQKACRLHDAVKCGANYWRVRADYQVLGAFVRTVDHWITRDCTRRFDERIRSCWATLKFNYKGISCLLDGCRGNCGHDGPGHAVGRVVPPVPDVYTQRVPRDYGRPGVRPPIAPHSQRQFGSPYLGRYGSLYRSPYGSPYAGRSVGPRYEFVDPRSRSLQQPTPAPQDARDVFQPSRAAPEWLDRFMAALDRYARPF